MSDDKTPRDRARDALMLLTHETGTATLRFTGMTLADITIDLETRVADAIADAVEAEQKRVRLACQALAHELRQTHCQESRVGLLLEGWAKRLEEL